MEEDKVKHLEFVQSNIARMNQCSVQMKGWAITLVTALLAVYAATINSNGVGKNWIIFIAIAPTILFWVLDSYYLCQERKFRALYNDIVTKSEIVPYLMPINEYKGSRFNIFFIMLSITELPLYSLMTAGLILAGVLL